MNKVFALMFLLVLFSLKTFSQDPVVFNGENQVIGQHVSILEDPAYHLNINSVKVAPGFVLSNIEVPNLQLSKSDFWLRFSIKNQTSEDHLLLSLDYPTLDVCDFYYPVNGKYHVQSFSDKFVFNQRKYKNQNFVFDINIPKGSTATCFLKVKSSEQMILPLILGTPQKIAESTLTQQLLWGILIGLIFVMVLYNLFVFISTKDKSYLFYVSYTTFIGLTQASLSGYTYHYIFYNAPSLFNKALIVFPGLAGISAVFFVSSFLHTKERTPK